MYSELTVGNTTIRNGIWKLDIWHSRREPIDILEVALKSEVRGVQLQKDLPAVFWFGYTSDKVWKGFAGTSDLVDGAFMRARDRMVALRKTTVTKVFLNATPQEIITHVLGLAGVTRFSLSGKAFPPRASFVAAGEDVYRLVLMVNREWGCSFLPYFDNDDLFHWEEIQPQTELPLFAYGDNIIRLEFDESAGTGMLLTIGAPFVNHSARIGLQHPKVPAAEALVEAVHHFLTDRETLRTEIFFSLEV